MKKYLVLGIALVLVITMGIIGIVRFTNDGAAEENRVELATMIEWEHERHDDYDYEIKDVSVKYRDGKTWAYYWAYIDGELSHYGSVDVTWLDNQYSMYH